MRPVHYKRVFLASMYLLYFICLLLSDIKGWGMIVVSFLSYSMILSYCYAYIFKLDIELPTGTIPLKNKYIRLIIFIMSASVIISMLLDLSGIVDLFDYQNTQNSLGKLWKEVSRPDVQ